MAGPCVSLPILAHLLRIAHHMLLCRHLFKLLEEHSDKHSDKKKGLGRWKSCSATNDALSALPTRQTRSLLPGALQLLAPPRERDTSIHLPSTTFPHKAKYPSSSPAQNRASFPLHQLTFPHPIRTALAKPGGGPTLEAHPSSSAQHRTAQRHDHHSHFSESLLNCHHTNFKNTHTYIASRQFLSRPACFAQP